MDDGLEIDGSLLMDYKLDIEDKLDVEEALLLSDLAFVFALVKPMVKPTPTPIAKAATIEINIGSFFIYILLINIDKNT